MGWSMPEEREKFSLEEFYANFDPNRLSSRGPVFDTEKLSWLNGLYIRELSHDELKRRIYDWAFGENRLDALLTLVQERSERFDDLFRQADYILGDRIVLDSQQFDHKSVSQQDCLRILDFADRRFESIEEWDRDTLYGALKTLSEAMSLKFRDFLFPLFLAIAGRSVALPLFDSLVLLGSDVTRIRLRSAIQTLGGISTKKRKILDKEWQGLSRE